MKNSIQEVFKIFSQVIINLCYEYFGKHAFRVWIENERIVSIDDTHVYFNYRNYDNKNEIRLSKVRGTEFIRRFLSYSLNKSFINKDKKNKRETYW